VQLLTRDGSALYYQSVFGESESTGILLDLIEGVDWNQEFINMYGRRLPIPRQTAWFGDSRASYNYSHIDNIPRPWTPLLLHIKAKVEVLARTAFNSVLLNLYRTGSDSVSWHADDEPELGDEPIIASVSFGAKRTFQFKSIADNKERISVPLESGSVLIMSGASQRAWLHQVPKKKTSTERVNLTFRVVGRKTS